MAPGAAAGAAGPAAGAGARRGRCRRPGTGAGPAAQPADRRDRPAGERALAGRRSAAGLAAGWRRPATGPQQRLAAPADRSGRRAPVAGQSCATGTRLPDAGAADRGRRGRQRPAHPAVELRARSGRRARAGALPRCQRRGARRTRGGGDEARAGGYAERSGRQYRRTSENTAGLISRHTLDGRFLDASPASWTLLGYWPEELRGSLARELFHAQDLAQLMARARSALEQDGYHTMTFRARHRDGRYLWFETACRAIRETYTGEVVEVVAVSRD